MATQITLQLYTTAEELGSAKNGSSMLVANKKRTDKFDVQFGTPLDACEFITGTSEVRVNMELVRRAFESLSEQMGAAMGKGLQEALAPLFAEG